MTEDQLKNRGLKTRKPLSNAIDMNLYDDFNNLHEQTRIPKSKLLDEAVGDLLEKYEKQGKFDRKKE